MTTKAEKRPVKLQKKTHPYNEAEHGPDVAALLDRLRSSPLAPRWPEIRPLIREIRAHLSVRIKRSELVELLRRRIEAPVPLFCGRLSPREASVLRTILRNGPDAQVRFYRGHGGAAMKVWIAGQGFVPGNTLSNAAAMALRKRGILLRVTPAEGGGDSGLFRLAPRASEAGMFWVQ